MMQCTRYAKKFPERLIWPYPLPITFHLSDKPTIVEGPLDFPDFRQILTLSIPQAHLVCRHSIPSGGPGLW